MSIYGKLLTGKWHSDLIANTNTIINSVYAKYQPYYDFILEFIKKNQHLVSCAELLLGEPTPLDKPLHIFVLDPGVVASEIFKLLCKKFGREFVLQIEVTDKHYSVSHIAKMYIRISGIEQYKNKSLIDYLMPVAVSGLVVLPPILELIDIYKKIYNPEYADEWSKLIAQAITIRDITDRNITDSLQALTAGGADISTTKGDDAPETCTDCKESEDTIMNELRADVIKFINTYPDYLHIYADHAGTLSIISKNSIEVDFKRINEYLDNHSNYNFTIIFKQKKLFIGKDQRIEKHSLYVMKARGKLFGATNVAFLDIYNNSSYELIPYIEHNKQRVSHKLVQIRFYYIEIWNIVAAYHLGLLQAERFKKLIPDIMAQIARLQIDWNDIPKQFIGIYVNEFRAYKQVMQMARKQTRIYCS
jgi:hypothetical protein